MNPVIIAIEDLNRMAEERYGWLSKAAKQIEEWKAEEACQQDNEPDEEAA